ncbi:MAG: phosphoribosylformylglycinamidine synthase subunit PurQ [Sulfurimonas sp.]|jgi:phosphoribosylformylglycinamidine synthase I|nr:phosphoribosylformylglycinamidine synthase subunit PurQ [Sulfurimonas sp.]MBU1217340.1 phosphoribosylformylglycinamidine synthase subunit PurQ [bacterium]MBU1433873.1 phosphoribosylformylglycinamidine synthase subunit PurQ [bacterium]MBU1503571.1 phosphoribosylformylglycinamidine synthase subunit PurQ [bacterium]MBU3939740.1 phosphoribosylformylglycinamidine synthase subunit PurQ [bacterium]
MKVSILQFPGTNCEYDTQHAFEDLGASTEIIWHKSETIPADTDLLVVAGGFSYGDYLRSGAIAKFSPVMRAVKEYASKGGKVLGICNGFQVLTEAGLLPGALKRNEHLHFISKHHHLKVINNDNIFLEKLNENDVVNIPIAHHDGNYYIDQNGLKELYANNQVLLKYSDAEGNDKNPNGSVDSIAGICNKEKNVFGLMPHPERAMEAILGSDDGVKMLQGFLK